MSESAPVTRFAPSPTGMLHIGGARTALFNWLYARGRRGSFLLRIEDTDRARSTPQATEAILSGLAWLGLDWDGEAVSQAARAGRHAEVARDMLAAGTAYKCFATQDEIAAFRERAKAAGRSTLYESPWRDADPASHPDAPYVVRLRAPRTGETVIADRVQGEVRWSNAELDDMVLLRADGSPTYMLAVVVDDADMGVTHVIRGDDHLNNAARQTALFRAVGWDEPVFAHIPLIHGPDGRKLSKRDGAQGVADYRAAGYPAAALRNYLARLGWSHGDAEVFSTDEAVAWFGFEGLGRAPARLDQDKLDHLAGRHISAMSDAALLHEIADFLHVTNRPALTAAQRDALSRALYCVKDRARSLPEVLDTAGFALAERPIEPDSRAAATLDEAARERLADLTLQLQNATWRREDLEAVATSVAEAHGIKLGKLAGPVRAALAGRSAGPSVFDIMLVIDREETLARLRDVTG